MSKMNPINIDLDMTLVKGHKNPYGIYPSFFFKKKSMQGTSLVMQWLRIHLPMQGTWVRSLVWEDPTCPGATKPMYHNY